MNIGIEIPADDSVRLLSNLLEEMDYTEILQASARGDRPLKYPSRILFKIWVYALMENIGSTRDIEKACRRDIHFRWLLEGHTAPSHSTISRFRQRISGKCIDQLFSQLLQILTQRNCFTYDHMRNGQLKPGYNAQIAVSSEYIVGAELYQARADQPTLIPFARKLETILLKKFKKIVADAGYESEEIYQFLKDNNYIPFIKPMNYEQKKKRSYKLKYGKPENMTYDEKRNAFTCKGGQILELVRSGKTKRASGYESEFQVYQSHDCSQCELAGKCKTTDKNKQIRVSHKFVKMREESNRNIVTEKGKLLRMNRSIQVEGAFGVLKQDYGFRRFFTKGIKATRKEFLLLCFAYNVNKFHAKIQKNKETLHLHPQKAG